MTQIGILHMLVDNSVARMQPKRNTRGRGNARYPVLREVHTGYKSVNYFSIL